MNLTGKEFTVSTNDGDITVKEFLMSDGKSKGLAFPCPCGRDILVDPRRHRIEESGGKLSIAPKIVCYKGPGRSCCGYSAFIQGGVAV